MEVFMQNNLHVNDLESYLSIWTNKCTDNWDICYFMGLYHFENQAINSDNESV